jgi:hypothetical protein
MEIQNKNIKKYINKAGDEKIYIYNQTEYNKRNYEKNKDKILNDYYECTLCDNKKILKCNKYNHEKSKLHNIYKTLKNI